MTLSMEAASNDSNEASCGRVHVLSLDGREESRFLLSAEIDEKCGSSALLRQSILIGSLHEPPS